MAPIYAIPSLLRSHCNVQQTLQNFVQEAESVRVNMADLAGL